MGCYSHPGWRKKSLDSTASPSVHDLLWVAGIFEGEGSFGPAQIEITQKDPWILDRCKSLFGGTVAAYKVAGYRQHVINRWTAHGSKARGFVMTIYQILSPRRQQRARLFLGRA